MKITFRIHYFTQWGQQVYITGSAPELGNGDEDMAVPMQYIFNGQWELTLTIQPPDESNISYIYLVRDEHTGEIVREWGENHQIAVGSGRFNEILITDSWRPQQVDQNAYFTSAFTQVLMRRKFAGQQSGSAASLPGGSLHRFRIYAPRVSPDLVVCLIGDDPALGSWNESDAIVMDSSQYPLWEVNVAFKGDNRNISFKYALYDPKEKRIVAWEAGENRTLSFTATRKRKKLEVHTHTEFRYPNGQWKGSGVAIPVFSLRSQNSTGVGEFEDIKLMVDWAASIGVKMIQVLPINDSIANHDWMDSYPYAAISVFALHPQYLNLQKMGKLKSKKLQEEFQQERDRLNALEDVDYLQVMEVKSRYFKLLYDQNRDTFLKSRKFKQFFDENKEWLVSYAAFSYLRDQYGTADFNQWPSNSVFSAEEIDALTAPDTPYFDDIAIHYFIQFHLHTQMLEATTYARDHGIVLKGDIPIGIYRHSVDAWVGRHLYNMNAQAGAPPDAFAVNGQNWRFPTYNWEIMAKDNYAWWRQRLTKMAAYFDAYRIDHILGFFRIWEIPGNAVDGLLGQFNPALPMSRHELAVRGLFFDYERFCQPYIREYMLSDFFGEQTEWVKQVFLDHTGDDSYRFKSGLATQREIEAYFDKNEAEIKLACPNPTQVRASLYSLVAEVLFLPATNATDSGYCPRIALHHTRSFQDLDHHSQHVINHIYNEFFYHRHEEFWREQALVKLPAIKNATNMLVCGEDLGMVPECVPGVMHELGLLSLEIQRMPKNPQQAFAHPADAPYLSVVSTSTHDMPTIRGWWEQDREISQRFFNHILGHPESAPQYCEPWVAREIIVQHLYSPGMWVVFPLQDLLALDGELRREDTHAEQINDPSNPENEWKYRIHLGLEALKKADSFNQQLRQLIQDSGRATAY